MYRNVRFDPRGDATSPLAYLGQVRVDGTVVLPGERLTDLDAFNLSVIETPEPVAIVNDGKGALGELPEHLARKVLDVGFRVVAFVAADAPGVALATVRGPAPDAVERAAAAIWSWKSHGGWEDAADLLCRIESLERPALARGALVHVTSEVSPGEQIWTVSVEPARDGIDPWLQRFAEGPSAHEGSVVLFDVDRFKAWNDAYGHGEGDKLVVRIVEVAEAVAGARCVRIGGDEFVVLLPAALESAIPIAERIRKAVEDLAIAFVHPELPERRVVTVSVAVARTRAGPARLRDALATAKSHGGNCAVKDLGWGPVPPRP